MTLINCSFADDCHYSYIFIKKEHAEAGTAEIHVDTSLVVCFCGVISAGQMCVVGLCDMDKKYISRFFDFFSDFDFNHDFDANRHALSYTSYLFLHFSLFYYTFYSLFFFFYLYMLLCGVTFI